MLFYMMPCFSKCCPFSCFNRYILDKFHSTSDEPTSDESLRITGSRGTADDDQDSDSDSLGPIQYRDSFDQFRNLSNQAQNGDSSDEDEG